MSCTNVEMCFSFLEHADPRLLHCMYYYGTLQMTNDLQCRMQPQGWGCEGERKVLVSISQRAYE